MSLSLHPFPRSGGAALALLGAILVLACDTRRTGDRPVPEARASTRVASDRASIALVPEPKHDFGRAVQGGTLRHAFVTRNPTNGAIDIEDTREILGCAGVPVPRVLAPGRTGKLEVTCRATIYGPLRVSLPLRAGGRTAGELSIAAEVEPLLAFERSLLEVNVPFGTNGFAEARLRGASASAAHLVPITRPPEGMAATVLAPTDAASQGVLLRVSHAAAGTHAGSLRFATGLPEPKEIELAYLVKVASTLAVSPTNPVLDLRAPATAKTVIRVTSQRPAFRVERVEVPEGPFDARVRRDGDAYAVEISIVTANLPRGMRGASGRLLIVSNDRAEPSKEVPLFALGSPAEVRDGGVR